MKFNPLVFIFLSFFWNCTGIQKTTPAFVPSFVESKETTHKIPKGQTYTFGYLEVLENRNDPAGNRLKLPVYIFKSRNASSKPDPIIYTVGGPGYSTMRSAQYMRSYQYLDDRDFILIEQRGTQYSQPSLDCPEWSEAVYLANLPSSTEDNSDSLFAQATFECKERLLKNGIDLNSYNTNEIAADIEDLRKALGLKTYNLLTISYSTKIAQVLLRDYPSAIRSVVMDSPLPLEVNYDEESVGNLLDVVEDLLTDCEADQECATAFPGVKKRFFNYLREKTENPLVVEVENPTSKKMETFYLKGEDLITVFTSSSTNNVASVPLEIEKILSGNLSSVKEQLVYLLDKPTTFSGIGIGMRLSVWCAEEYPFTSPSKIESEKSAHPAVKGLSPAVFKDEVCKIWAVKKVAAIENEPVKSNVPVLLTSGEYDNETPVKWAAAMKKNFPNSHHLIFKGWKHTVTTNWSNPCAMEAANQFFNNPKEKPNPACFEEITSLKFKTE